jgi:Chaperone of endosialidase
MKTTTLSLRNLVNRSPLRAFLLIPFVLACFGLSSQARATCQEGCDPGHSNTFLGDDALISNTSGGSNVAIGTNALMSNTIGSGNTASGIETLFSNISGAANTATGALALHDNTTGNDNTANGYAALFSNTSGIDNTANGFQALIFNTIGSDNTANGFKALFNNTTGGDNAANGAFALFSNTTGSDNTADGFRALFNNTTGTNNTATGRRALHHNRTGNNNTANGNDALFNNTGSNNIALGFQAGKDMTTGSNNIDIGNTGLQVESNTIRIGTVGTQTATFIAGISGATVPTGVAVIVDSDGHLGTTTSSARFKEAIKPMDKASEAILALKPVTFHYKPELDPAGVPQFGLVAEEVEKVNPDLVARDADGKAYTVRYDAVNAMLLNEFLKEHRTVQEQKEIIAQLKHDFAHQQKQIEALTAGLQKVSDQLELSKPAPQIVLNNQ